MFQTSLQYNSEDRFASFYVDETQSKYQDLLKQVKKAVLFLQGVDNQQIIISYKDLSLQTFINIDRNDSLHVSEAFRNALPCVRSFQPGFPGKYVPMLNEFVDNIGYRLR